MLILALWPELVRQRASSSEGWSLSEAMLRFVTDRRMCSGEIRERALMMGGENSPMESKDQLRHPFADLVIFAGWLHPIPFRTRP